MDSYIIKINGLYLEGYDYEKVVGQAGATHGHYIEANDMAAIILTEDKKKARLVEGAINLKSQMDRIMTRIRYRVLEVEKLEVLKVEGS